MSSVFESTPISHAEADEKGVTTTTQDGVDYDTGSATSIIPPPEDVGYHRVLDRRQIMMMTFGAGIGTGLWVGIGSAMYYGM